MRRIWILRHKAAAGRMAAMNVYMEDPEGDTEISGILCRKLGQVKNGQKKRFQVAEEAVKIFVVSGNGGKKEQPFIQLEEGEDDIFLSGKVARGKKFRFDGMEETPEQQKRERGKGLGTVILVLAILLGIGGGVFAGWKISDRLLNGTTVAAAAEKTFSVEQLRLTLTDAFAEGTLSGYTACYSSGEVSVYVLREGFDAFEGFGDLTVAGYGTMVLANNGLTDAAELTEEGDKAFFDHRYGEYAYHCVLLKGSDAFWMVQFAVPGEMAEAYAADVDRWAKSVSFAG